MFIEGEKTWWEPPKVRSLLSDEQELRYDKCRWMEPRKHREKKVKRGEFFLKKHLELLFEDEEREFYL